MEVTSVDRSGITADASQEGEQGVSATALAEGSVVCKTRKRFQNKIVHVYCPVEDEQVVRQVASRVAFSVKVNEYDVSNIAPSKLVVCHHKHYKLTKEQKDFLIQKTISGAWVEPFVSFIDKACGYTAFELLHEGYFLHQKAFSILSTPAKKVVKRISDIVFSVVILMATLPISLLTAIAIKLESKGPVFYKQARVGLFDKEFDVIKFRSMGVDAEKGGAKWAQKNDPRVTRVGNFIRKTRIDEIPQLINVLKGEMSLVGPRPERQVFIDELEKDVKFYNFRHAVKPGVTGLAQVRYPYGASVEDAIWKHRYDLHYIKHQSFWMDVKIILLTIKVVIFGMGR